MTFDAPPGAEPVAEPVARPEDAPLHDDVRWLAATLGRVIRRLEGEAAFDTVETLRRATRARRRGLPGAESLPELLARVEALPPEQAALAARAFTLFFLLINTAEQVQRVRRRSAYLGTEHRGAEHRGANAAPQPASARWAMRRLREGGHGAAEVADAVARLDVRPVLTAHPTESTRRTLLGLQARVADLLLGGTYDDEALAAEVELLWLTAEVRDERPSVLDEVGTVLWYLETRLLDAGARARASLVRAFEAEYGGRDDGEAGPGGADVVGRTWWGGDVTAVVGAAGTVGTGGRVDGGAGDVVGRVRAAVPLSFGNWVGGDRDGNPFVTPETTVAAARRSSYAMLGRYRAMVDALVERLSVAARLAPPPPAFRASLEADGRVLPEVWAANARRNADEPLRLKLSLVGARLEATRRRVAARDAGRPALEPAAYPDAAAFMADLVLVRDYLASAGAAEAERSAVEPLLAMARAHGLHGFRMDVRDHADAHRDALAAVAAAVGCPPLDADALRRELAGRRPLTGPELPLGDAARRVLDTFRAVRLVQDEGGEAAAGTYVVSMTREPEDLLRVLVLAREAGLVDLAAEPPVSRLDVVPLFETLADLERAPDVLGALFADPAYARQLRARGWRQEVMIGYSDSGKDAGMLASSWALYAGQERIAEACRAAGVALRLFHGRGGSVGRGGGSPVARALAALPPDTAGAGVKITEQGEIISQQFGLAPLAERTLEVTLAGTLLHALADWRDGVDAAEVAAFRARMQALADRSLGVYRALVHEGDAVFHLFLSSTPVAALAAARFGSRPAYRPGAGGGVGGIRAIPWQFGWTQIRLLLPGWLGVGTALAEAGATPEGLAELRRMAEAWPFFDDLLAKIEMVCAKADLEVARLYVAQLGTPEDARLLAELEAEFRRTVGWVLRVRGADELLADQPVLRAAVALRNPYVDPLSLLQIALLKRVRAEGGVREDGAVADPVDGAALAATLSGVAQGLRNTG